MSSRRLKSEHIYLWGLGASLILHAVLVIVLIWMPKPPPAAATEPIMVSMEFNQPRQPAPNLASTINQKRQIVSQTNQKAEDQPKLDARLLSDKNSIAEHEQIRRGTAPDAGPAPGPQGGAQALNVNSSKPAPKAALTEKQPAKETERSEKRADKSISPKPERAQSQTTEAGHEQLKYLALDNATLQNKFGAPEEQQLADKDLSAAVQGRLDNTLRGDVQRNQPFSRPYGSGARFFGRSGDSDFLPNLPDGDITLLNTKADQYAVFVRRVALQVFAKLRESGWEFLNPNDIRTITTECTVIAVISPHGDLLRAKIDNGSGSPRFDSVLLRAVHDAAHDPNPPLAAALSDGNIHFIFKSKSWLQFSGDPRSPAPVERRWLMLATGLE